MYQSLASNNLCLYSTKTTMRYNRIALALALIATFALSAFAKTIQGLLGSGDIAKRGSGWVRLCYSFDLVDCIQPLTIRGPAECVNLPIRALPHGGVSSVQVHAANCKFYDG